MQGQMSCPPPAQDLPHAPGVPLRRRVADFSGGGGSDGGYGGRRAAGDPPRDAREGARDRRGARGLHAGPQPRGVGMGGVWICFDRLRNPECSIGKNSAQQRQLSIFYQGFEVVLHNAFFKSTEPGSNPNQVFSFFEPFLWLVWLLRRSYYSDLFHRGSPPK